VTGAAPSSAGDNGGVLLVTEPRSGSRAGAPAQLSVMSLVPNTACVSPELWDWDYIPTPVHRSEYGPVVLYIPLCSPTLHELNSYRASGPARAVFFGLPNA